MASQTLSQPQHLAGTTNGLADDPSTTLNGAATGTLSAIDSLTSNIGTWAQDILDRFFPPEQRDALLAKLKAFVLANPKVSAFLGMNIAFTGIPLGLFTLFGLSVAVFSVLGGIILGLLGAVLVTLTCIGLTLTIVFPILMFTTASACFLFLFGLGGYKILKWASSAQQGEGQATREGEGMTVGEGLNSLTGGRLTGLLNSAKTEREKQQGIEGFSDENNPPVSPRAPKKSEKESVNDAIGQTSAGKVTKRTPQTPTAPVVGKTVKATPVNPVAQKKRADEKGVVGAVGVV